MGIALTAFTMFEIVYFQLLVIVVAFFLVASFVTANSFVLFRVQHQVSLYVCIYLFIYVYHEIFILRDSLIS